MNLALLGIVTCGLWEHYQAKQRGLKQWLCNSWTAHVITEAAAERLRSEQHILSRYTGQRMDLHLKQEDRDAINY